MLLSLSMGLGCDGADNDAGRVDELETMVAAQASTIADLSARLAVLETAGFVTDAEIASRMAVVDDLAEVAKLAPFLTVEGTEIVVAGANVNVVSGSGATDADPNGLGNLVVGYNELDDEQPRTGSHNVVVGPFHAYSSYGGLLAGSRNSLSAPHASILSRSRITCS